MRNQWAKLGGVVGIVYCIAGFVLIFLGWNGAASNDRVEAQLPYLVSGGVAGLGLVVLGSALIVAHSLRTDRVELKAAIEELRRSATGAAAGRAPTPAAASGPDDEVIAGAESYHRPSCTVAAGQSGATTMRASEAMAAGLTPCRVCRPDEAAVA